MGKMEIAGHRRQDLLAPSSTLKKTKNATGKGAARTRGRAYDRGASDHLKKAGGKLTAIAPRTQIWASGQKKGVANGRAMIGAKRAAGKLSYLPPNLLAKARRDIETTDAIRKFAAQHKLTQSETLSLYLLTSSDYLNATVMADEDPEAEKFNKIVNDAAAKAMGKIVPNSPEHRRMGHVASLVSVFHDSKGGVPSWAP